MNIKPPSESSLLDSEDPRLETRAEEAGSPAAPEPDGLNRLTLRFGERLVAARTVTPQQLEEALAAQRTSGGFLGETMIELGLITPAQLGAVLEEIYGVPYVDLTTTLIDPAAVALVPEKLAQQRLMLP